MCVNADNGVVILFVFFLYKFLAFVSSGRVSWSEREFTNSVEKFARVFVAVIGMISASVDSHIPERTPRLNSG